MIFGVFALEVYELNPADDPFKIERGSGDMQQQCKIKTV